jgi:alanine racemase
MAIIEISKKNLFHNLKQIENRLGSKEKIAVCLKDNAYGHGLELMAKLCNEYGITKGVVRNIYEANIVYKYFKKIIVLQHISSERILKNIELVISSLEDIRKIPKNSKVHLKIDTGMHRNGIHTKDIKKAFNLIQENNLILKGVMTHFKSADVLNSALFWQNDIFQKCKQEIITLCNKQNIKIPLFSSENSSSLSRLDKHEDFVRVGIAIYGYCYISDKSHDLKLKPILSIYANKISSRIVSPHQNVGYGGCGNIIKKNTTISTYDLGYGNGFPRLNENDIFYTTNNEKVIGRVSMSNMCIESDKQKILIFDDVKHLAKIKDTISYDILVSLSPFITRICNTNAI